MAVYDREEDAPQVHLYGRKMKLLEVMRILERETDAEHALTANRIAARLEEKGFPHADRKGIYDDINVLNCFLKPGGGGGCKRPRIEKDEITFGYYLDNRPFSVADLKLIIDALLSSRFLSEAKTMELVGALESLCSVHQAKGLKRQIIVANRVKNMNANVLNNADHIHAAIDRDVCIRFRYFDYGVKMERILRKKGAWYVVSPLALVYCDDNYIHGGLCAARKHGKKLPCRPNDKRIGHRYSAHGKRAFHKRGTGAVSKLYLQDVQRQGAGCDPALL